MTATERPVQRRMIPAAQAGFAAVGRAVANPDHLRMLTWARPDGFYYAPPGLPATPQDKFDALRQDQRLGIVDPSPDIRMLLPVLFAIGPAPAQSPDPADGSTDPAVLAQQREALQLPPPRINLHKWLIVATA